MNDKTEQESKDYFLKALDHYDHFLAKTGVDRLQKILARYELFKMSLDIPGDIVECGVFKGSGLYTLAKLNNLFRPHSERKVIGFDFFESDRQSSFKYEIDQTVLDAHATRWSPQEVIKKNLSQMGITNVELVAGNVVRTTEDYVKKNVGFRISFLYLDVDNYEGSLAILKHLYPFVSRGGVVAFDEYACRSYGESDAVDEFFAERKISLRSLSWANTPTAYCIKE